MTDSAVVFLNYFKIKLLNLNYPQALSLRIGRTASLKRFVIYIFLKNHTILDFIKISQYLLNVNS
jgi:hypothetical protein